MQIFDSQEKCQWIRISIIGGAGCNIQKHSCAIIRLIIMESGLHPTWQLCFLISPFSGSCLHGRDEGLLCQDGASLL